MLSTARKHPFFRVIRNNFRKINYSSESIIDINEEVRLALDTKKPVVALESTIITHGMPYPENLKCAFEVEDIVRKKVIGFVILPSLRS